MAESRLYDPLDNTSGPSEYLDKATLLTKIALKGRAAAFEDNWKGQAKRLYKRTYYLRIVVLVIYLAITLFERPPY
jgi:hypothetical protein